MSSIEQAVGEAGDPEDGRAGFAPLGRGLGIEGADDGPSVPSEPGRPQHGPSAVPPGREHPAAGTKRVEIAIAQDLRQVQMTLAAKHGSHHVAKGAHVLARPHRGVDVPVDEAPHLHPGVRAARFEHLGKPRLKDIYPAAVAGQDVHAGVKVPGPELVQAGPQAMLAMEGSDRPPTDRK
jgi:hypothetical protein